MSGLTRSLPRFRMLPSLVSRFHEEGRFSGILMFALFDGEARWAAPWE